jgi:glycerol uptake facilitator-like aquaporin
MQFNTKHPDVKFKWRNIASEYLGTLLFVFISTTTFVSWTTFEKNSSFLVYGLTQGLTLSVIVHIFISISGAHVNPAITVSTMITRYIGEFKNFLKKGFLEGLLYITSQFRNNYSLKISWGDIWFSSCSVVPTLWR